MVLKVIISYVEKNWNNLQLCNGKEWLLIADVFVGQWTDEVKKIIEENNGKDVSVPNSMAHIFELLNLTVTRLVKAFLHKNVQDWYSNEFIKNRRQTSYYFETLSCIMGDKVLRQIAK